MARTNKNYLKACEHGQDGPCWIRPVVHLVQHPVSLGSPASSWKLMGTWKGGDTEGAIGTMVVGQFGWEP